ncbi:MAG: FkbM family methyltransferase [Deltaproteobacteria bacterium RBG_16_58_17]|nr:MAG: FkbM family methyltransferase [Deltaproteobacteria bacterium RBG_16_58_17]OHE19040.1 MAG: FkbM family methyltransferase [Syntrophobacterales bacterium GWC2_56_13]OHE20433.1 MAG: FkbM family methyltransferase [Syntrophobacterales bacterium GWF2_56_9]
MVIENQNIKNEAEGNIDRIVQRRFFPGNGSGKIFVEVGAARPDYLSLSALYRSLGWRIIAIEPNPEFCTLHREKGYEILEYACGDQDKDNVDFFVVDSHGTQYINGEVSYESFSSLGIKNSYAALKSDLDMKKIQVNLRRLDTILKVHASDITHIDILSVDTEGWELEVIDGLDVPKYRPRVMIIENIFNEKKYRTYMQGINYILWKRIAPNDIYVGRELFPNAIQRRVVYLKGLFMVLRNK